jgi:hypothetical protein
MIRTGRKAHLERPSSTVGIPTAACTANQGEPGEHPYA